MILILFGFNDIFFNKIKYAKSFFLIFFFFVIFGESNTTLVIYKLYIHIFSFKKIITFSNDTRGII